MSDWVAPVVTLAGTVLVVLGGTLGAVLTYRVQKRQATTARENKLIDQLQEELVRQQVELTRYQTEAGLRATAQDERMERIEKENAQLRSERERYREYAHQLRGHIYDELGPPPPSWPDGLTA